MKLNKNQLIKHLKEKHNLVLTRSEPKHRKLLAELDQELIDKTIDIVSQTNSYKKILSTLIKENNTKMTKKRFFKEFIYNGKSLRHLYYQELVAQKRHPSGIYQAWIEYQKKENL